MMFLHQSGTCSYLYYLFLVSQCHRMVTVRELARSQGFPDWFVFYSINDNVVTVRPTHRPFSLSKEALTTLVFHSSIQPDAPTNRKRSSLARGRGNWT
jgi:C-5 cytosine-specific DNA methylase